MDKINVEAMCRVCMELHASCEPLKWETDLLEKFIFVSSLQVDPVDKLPKRSLCNACTQLTEEFYKFKIKCAESDSKFRAITLESKLANRFSGCRNLELEEDFPAIQDKRPNSEPSFIDKTVTKNCVQRNKGSKSEDGSIIRRPVKCFKCNECDKKFSTQRKLDGHLREHQGLKAAVCEHCGKEFQKFRYLDFHIRQHHTERVRTWPCSVEGCDKIFKSESGYFNHRNNMHNDNGRRKFICDTCGKTMSTRGSLSAHKMTHTGVRNYACEQCSKRFYSAYALKIHVMYHNDIKDYICQICGARKVSEVLLKYHIRDKHSDEKRTSAGKFACICCENTFCRSHDLNIHMMIHTGGKYFTCNVCGNNYAKQRSLTEHQNKKHPQQ